MKTSRLLTLLASVAVAGVSAVKPQWGDLLYAAIGLAGWALPHVADRKPR